MYTVFLVLSSTVSVDLFFDSGKLVISVFLTWLLMVTKLFIFFSVVVFV